ncbi:MAG TPA: Hsp20/alpha crystallin family protein [Chloroflexi bacterium]|nr:Hsp20/alpha crystallin family protein [Chloroflexota bacterium]
MGVRRKAIWEEWGSGGTEIQHLLREGWVVLRQSRAWEPPTDVYENDEGLVVQIEIAGMREEDLSITLDERLLVVEGIRRDPEPKRAYHQMEIRYGPFRTEVHLPWTTDPEQVEAIYEAGFLKIKLPRPPARRVPVTQR